MQDKQNALTAKYVYILTQSPSSPARRTLILQHNFRLRPPKLNHTTRTNSLRALIMSTYLVVQATGGQSRWTIHHLLAANQKVHALVRDPSKPLPHPLTNNPSITIFKGTNSDTEAIYAAAKGCKGAFLNTYPYPGPEAEQTKAQVEACKNAGVKSIVASSTYYTDRKEIWDNEEMEEIGLRGYYASKASVEDVIRGSGLVYTIVRPAFLNSNYFFPGISYNHPELPTQGIIYHAYEPGSRVVHIDTADIGKYAAAALLDPVKFGGQEIDLANIGYTIAESAEILSKVSGRKVIAKRRTDEEIEKLKPTVPGQKFQLRSKLLDPGTNEESAAKVQEKYGIKFTSLEVSLRRDINRLLECIPEKGAKASN